MASPKRQHQVEKQILRRLALALQRDLKDPRAGFVTITRVEITADLTHAKVYWSVLDPRERSRMEHVFRSAHGFLRTLVARDLQLRNAPQLSFHFDESLAFDERLEEILRRERERSAAATTASEGPVDGESGPRPDDDAEA